MGAVGEEVVAAPAPRAGCCDPSRARHSFVSFFLGTLLGNFITLSLCSICLVFFGAFAWMAAGCTSIPAPVGADRCAEAVAPDDFWPSFWLSWGLHFDPGTQTGLSAVEGHKQKWVAVSFSILGFVLNLIFLGLIVENIRVVLDSWRRVHGRIIANDHIVVLGWTDKTLFLLGELAEMLKDSVKGGGTIVVLGELDPIEMRMEVNIAYPDWRNKWRKVRVRYCQGKPFEVDDLLKVSVYAAERVIVLGASRKPRVADSQMLTTICAIRCLPGARVLKPGAKLIADLKQPQNEPVVIHIGGGGDGGAAAAGGGGLAVTPVVGLHAANSLLSLAALDSCAAHAARCRGPFSCR